MRSAWNPRPWSPELAQVLDEIARHPERERFAFDPLWLVELGPDPFLPLDWRTSRIAQLERELARVNRGELARLCRAAAVLRLCAADRTWVDPCAGTSDARGHALDAEELRACLREELELGASGLCPDVLLEVPRRCLADDLARWPSATALAAVSLLLAPHEHGRLRLGQALFAAGATRDAARVFAASLAREPSRRGRRLLLGGLGCARLCVEREGGAR